MNQKRHLDNNPEEKAGTKGTQRDSGTTGTKEDPDSSRSQIEAQEKDQEDPPNDNSGTKVEDGTDNEEKGDNTDRPIKLDWKMGEWSRCSQTCGGGGVQVLFYCSSTSIKLCDNSSKADVYQSQNESLTLERSRSANRNAWSSWVTMPVRSFRKVFASMQACQSPLEIRAAANKSVLSGSHNNGTSVASPSALPRTQVKKEAHCSCSSLKVVGKFEQSRIQW